MRLISLDEVVKKIEHEIEQCEPVNLTDNEYEAFIKRVVPNLLRDVINYLERQPTVEAVPVVHGRWEQRTDAFGFVRCSVCHDCNIYDDWADGKKWNYCPDCGAKMDGGNEDGNL